MATKRTNWTAGFLGLVAGVAYWAALGLSSQYSLSQSGSVAQEKRIAELRAQYPATTTYSTDGLSARGEVRSLSGAYSEGYASGCLAGAGGPQLKKPPFDWEGLRGWKAGKRSCKAKYDQLLQG